MKIKKLFIKGYGKFINQTIELKDGFNVIYGNNEAGKSTLQSFIKNSLFSFESKNKDKEGRLPDLKKYKPWNHEEYAGYIDVQLDNDKEYRIEKDFKNKETNIFNSNLENITSLFSYSKREGVLFGESIFKMNRNTFENTAFIKQSSTKVFKDDKQEIFDKIINLQETGEEDLSVTKAIKALSKAKTDLGHKTTKGRLYNITVEKLEKAKIKLNKANENRERMLEKQGKQKQLKKEINEIIIDIENIRKEIAKEEKNDELEQIDIKRQNLVRKLEILLSYDKKINDINEKIYNYEKEINNNKQLETIDSNAIVEKIKQVALLKSDIEELEKKDIEKYQITINKKNKSSLLYLYMGIGLGVLSTILGIIISPYIFILSLISLFIIGYSFYVKPKKEDINKIQQMKQEKKDITQKGKDLLQFVLNVGYLCNDNIIDIEKTLNKIYTDKNNMYKLNTDIDIEKNRKKDYVKLKEDELMQLQYSSIIEVKNKIKEYEQQLKENNYIETSNKTDYKKILEENIVIKNQKQIELAKIQTLLREFWMGDEELANLTEEIAKYEEILINIEKEKTALEYAINFIEQAAKDIKLDIIPKINKKMGDVLSKITANKYNNLITGKDSQLNTEFNNSVLNIWQFSDGTIDQMYLALRIATTEIFSSYEKLPILIDEAFAFYDSDRMNNSFKLLYEISKEKQVIFFTCKEDELERISKLESVNIIKL